ncbi:hypothetical protein D3C71_1719500 [compost metagenome]
MDRALLGHRQQFIDLGVGQLAMQGQLGRQAVDALAFLAGVAHHFHPHRLQRQFLALRIDHQRHRLAAAQRGIEIVVRIRAFALGLRHCQRQVVAFGRGGELQRVRRILTDADAHGSDLLRDGRSGADAPFHLVAFAAPSAY